MKRALLALALTAAACKKEQPAAAAEAARANQAVTQAPAEGEYVVTSAKLDAFVMYQEKVLEVWSGSMKDLASMSAKADAGRYEGTAGTALAAQDLAVATERRAAAEEAARKVSGLTDADVEFLEHIVADVIAKRSLGRNTDMALMLEPMEKAMAGLPAEQREAMQKSIAEMKKQQHELTQLSEERRKYGSANVDAVLAREKELTRNWEAMLTQVWGGGRK